MIKRVDYMSLITDKTIIFEEKKEGRFTRMYVIGTLNYITERMFNRLVKQFKQKAVVKMVFA